MDFDQNPKTPKTFGAGWPLSWSPPPPPECGWTHLKYGHNRQGFPGFHSALAVGGGRSLKCFKIHRFDHLHIFPVCTVNGGEWSTFDHISQSHPCEDRFSQLPLGRFSAFLTSKLLVGSSKDETRAKWPHSTQCVKAGPFLPLHLQPFIKASLSAVFIADSGKWEQMCFKTKRRKMLWRNIMEHKMQMIYDDDRDTYVHIYDRYADVIEWKKLWVFVICRHRFLLPSMWGRAALNGGTLVSKSIP